LPRRPPFAEVARGFVTIRRDGCGFGGFFGGAGGFFFT
jgi:hypothetical protein